MSCQRCDSTQVAQISAKCSDCCSVIMPGCEDWYSGYVPGELGIGAGDYVEFKWCLSCGQIQGKFPIQQLTEETEGQI